MKIVSYLLNKLNGFKIGITEEGNAQLISYRNHSFTNTGGGAKRVEAFVEHGEHDDEITIAQSKYDELNVGDVLVGTVSLQDVTLETIVITSAPNAKLIFVGDKFNRLLPSITYPGMCLLSKDGEQIAETEVTKENDTYSAIIAHAFDDQFTAAYNIVFGLDATLVKLERCDGSFEPTEVVSGATLDVKTVEFYGSSVTCPCLSFSDNFIPRIDTYCYKATLTDGEINFSISYQGIA